MPLIWIVLPIILALACYWEIRERRIPNWLTLGAVALGLGAAAIEGGVDGLTDSALGLAVAGGLFLPFFTVAGSNGTPPVIAGSGHSGQTAQILNGKRSSGRGRIVYQTVGVPDRKDYLGRRKR